MEGVVVVVVVVVVVDGGGDAEQSWDIRDAVLYICASTG